MCVCVCVCVCVCAAELVWKVGRYTSAAPFYFTEFENYIDGGILANNPSEASLTAIQDHYHHKKEKIPISLLVSMGSGNNPETPLGEIDIKKNLLNPRAYLDLMEVLESAVRANCLTYVSYPVQKFECVYSGTSLQWPPALGNII